LRVVDQGQDGEQLGLRADLDAEAVLAAVLTAGAWGSVLPAAGLWLPTVLTVMFALATFASVLG